MTIIGEKDVAKESSEEMRAPNVGMPKSLKLNLPSGTFTFHPNANIPLTEGYIGYHAYLTLIRILSQNKKLTEELAKLKAKPLIEVADA